MGALTLTRPIKLPDTYYLPQDNTELVAVVDVLVKAGMDRAFAIKQIRERVPDRNPLTVLVQKHSVRHLLHA